jgi:hypothetical protein
MHYDNKIKDDELGGPCNTHVTGKKLCGIANVKPTVQRLHERYRCTKILKFILAV